MSNTLRDNLCFDAVIKNLFISDIIVTQKEIYTHIVGSLSIFPKSKVSESSLFVLQSSSGINTFSSVSQFHRVLLCRRFLLPANAPFSHLVKPLLTFSILLRPNLPSTLNNRKFKSIPRPAKSFKQRKNILHCIRKKE